MEFHPLYYSLVKIITDCWEKLGDNEIDNIKIFRIMDMQCVGGALEKLIAKNIDEKFKDNENECKKWEGCPNNKKDKDVVCLYNPDYSFEIKTSSNKGLRVFGNRSYSNVSEHAIKSRDSYVLTINVDLENWKICLIRFGKLNREDWIGQKSSTGQQARITKNAYQNKLKIIKGDYQKSVPVKYIPGIGGKTVKKLNDNNIFTVNDLLNCDKKEYSKQKNLANVFIKQDYI